MLRRQSLTILTSQPLSRHSVVQILPTWPSKSAPIYHAIFQRVWLPNGSLATAWCKFCRVQLKSAPTPPQPLTIYFPTALVPQRGANFADLTFQKCSYHAVFQRVWLPNGSLAWYKFCGLRLQKVVRPCQFLAILVSKPLFRPSVATSWAAGLSRPPVFGSCLCKPTAATQLWTNVEFRAIPTRQNDRVSHVCAVSFLRDHIFCWRIFGDNALYSRKLDSYISIVLSDVNLSDVGYVYLSLPACLVYLPFVSPLLKSIYIYIYINWWSGP